MPDTTLTIDLGALQDNWRALNKLTKAGAETGAVVKANAYGIGVAAAGKALFEAGARVFFVAQASEGAALRQALGSAPVIFVFNGLMDSAQAIVRDNFLIPMLNSPEQIARFSSDMHGHPCGLQLDSGMNRLGLEPADFADCADIISDLCPMLVQSHLGCADEADHPMNAQQLQTFAQMTAHPALNGVPRSLAATGGILLGPEYHFDMVRPGIGLYGGAPFSLAKPVVRLDLPVIQTRDVDTGESVGYGATWTARRPSRIATLNAGYADGLIRALGSVAQVYADSTPCPIVGRVSMDLITVDVTDLPQVPEALNILGPHQSVDQLAAAAGTIGYEILTSLGARYKRRYIG